MIPGMLKNKLCIVIRVMSELLRSPSVRRTANSYLRSSTSVYIKEKMRMKLSKQTKKITVANTLLSMNSTTR